MAVTKDDLRTILDAFGGIPMSDEELEEATKTVNGYLLQVESAKDLDTSQAYSGRVIHLEKQE